MKVIVSLEQGVSPETRAAAERELAAAGFVADPTKERLAKLGTLMGELGEAEADRLQARAERREFPGVTALEPDRRRR